MGMVCTIVNPLHEMFSPISVCTMCVCVSVRVSVCVCVCVCASYTYLYLNPCWCVHYVTLTVVSVLVFVKLQITFSISVHYVCYIMFVQHYEPWGKGFTNFSYCYNFMWPYNLPNYGCITIIGAGHLYWSVCISCFVSVRLVFACWKIP